MVKQKHLLYEAHGKKYSLLDLKTISNEGGTVQSVLERVVDRHCSNSSLFGEQSLLVLYGSEHLTAEGASFLKTRNVVLMTQDLTPEMKTHFVDRIQWINHLTQNEMHGFLKAKFPSESRVQRDNIISKTGGDMRQAVIQVQLRIDGKDNPDHARDDCYRALYGDNPEVEAKEIPFHGANWVHHNAGLVNASLEDLRKFQDDEATVDVFSTFSGSEPYLDVELTDGIAQSSRTLAIASFKKGKQSSRLIPSI